MDLVIILLCVLCVFAVVCGVYLFLVLPCHGAKRRSAFFDNRTLYAHRGLYKNPEVPENSIAAFRLAASRGYGMELDVRLSKDGELIVFHDDKLKRICGAEGRPEDYTYTELLEMPLYGTAERIPLFSEVLAAVKDAPLIVEIKGTDNNTEVCRKTAEALDAHTGPYCMESFNPIYVRWFKLHRPQVVRGQLSWDMKKRGPVSRRLRDFMLEHMLFNFLSRPDFLAYDLRAKRRFSFNVARFFGGYPVAWTVKSQEQLEGLRADYRGFIFEDFEAR